jgi:hypothetical protein
MTTQVPANPADNSVAFSDARTGLAATLRSFSQTLPPGNITVRDLLAMIGEQGMLFACIIMTIPFLTPIPLPGVSTVFGALIMLIAVGVTLNRLPWMPGMLLSRPIASGQLSKVLERGASLFDRVERFIRPRLLAMTHKATTNRLNGIMLFFGGALLIAPLPVLPLSNFLPGWGILLLAAGMIQRDGVFVLVGYALNIITFVYFLIVAIGVILAGQSVTTLFQDPAFILPLLR